MADAVVVPKVEVPVSVVPAVSTVPASAVGQSSSAPVLTPDVKVEAPKVEAPKVETKPEVKEAPSLIAVEPVKAPEPKVDDKTKDAQAVKIEAPKVEEPKPLEPIKYDFKLPENIKLDDAQTNKFSEIAGKHRVSPEAAQEILDLYVGEVQRLASSEADVWARTNESWVNAVRADPEIGGNRMETVLTSVQGMIERFGGKPEEKASLRQAFTFTGAGNHPDIIRFLSRAASALGEGRPVPAPTPKEAPLATDRATRRYGTKG